MLSSPALLVTTSVDPLQELPFLEIGRQPRHGVSRGPDYLDDFLMREGQRELDLPSS
jgi:hypothetical protein